MSIENHALMPYEIRPRKVEMDWGELTCVVLGERARARGRALVPCPEADGEDGLLHHVVRLARTRSGRPKILRAAPSAAAGWLMFLSHQGPYTRGAPGFLNIYAPHAERCRLVAAGQWAWGDAGGLGGGIDALVVAPPGVLIRVRPAGGKKTEGYALWTTPDAVLRIERDEWGAFLDAHSDAPQDIPDLFPPKAIWGTPDYEAQRDERNRVERLFQYPDLLPRVDGAQVAVKW